MKIEDQVVSLELAREMKELGAEQDSLWYWTWARWNEKGEWVLISLEERARIKKENFSAFTVAELGEKLPEGYFSQKQFGSWGCANSDNTFGISNVYDCDCIYSEAEVRAKMWIYLNKEGLI